MENSRPPEIKPGHLQRLAAVYRRQSSLQQVERFIGSAAAQRDQALHAARLGWPDSMIRIFDDLGYTGTTARRPAYQELVGLIASGQVGALFLAYISRAGREAIEYFTLLQLCADNDVLVVVDGRPYDMRHSGSLLLTRLQAVIAEYENSARTEMMQAARRAKAQMGLAVTAMPAPYVRLPDGRVEFHSDPVVRAAVRAGVDTFLSLRSIRGAVRDLRRRNAQFPRLLPGGGFKPVDWTVPTLKHLLTSPVLRGELHFPQTKIAGRDSATGAARRVAVPLTDRIVFRDHHPALITRSEADEIDRSLHNNSRGNPRQHLGPGDMILQGLLSCPKHPGKYRRRTLKMHSGRSGGREVQEPYYFCDADYINGGHKCLFVPARAMEEAVRDAVLARLAPARLEVLREELRRAAFEESAERRRLKRDAQAAEERIEQIKELLFDGPIRGNQLALLEYERELNCQLELRRHLEARLAEALRDASSPPVDSLQNLLGIEGAVREVWHLETTSNRDRKELLGCLVERVAIDERTPYLVGARIVWADGAHETPLQVLLPRYAHVVIDECYARGLKPKQIVSRLAELGLRTTRGGPWTRERIASRRHLSKKPGKRQGQHGE